MINTFLHENKSPALNAIICSILFWVLLTACLFGNGAITAMLPPTWSKPGFALTAIFATFIIIWLFGKLEKRSLKEIGLVWERATLARFIKGILIGSALFAVMIFVLLSFGKLQLQYKPAPFTWMVIPAFMSVLLLAFMEEAIFRSYTFLKLNKAFGLWITQVVVAIVFALYHVVGGGSLHSAFMGPGVWAFVFGLAAIWSGGIAMPTGIHVALNILQQLAGMKGNEYVIWKLSYKPGVTAGQMAQTEQLGMVLHLAVLTGAVLLTGWYIRNKKNKVPAV